MMKRFILILSLGLMGLFIQYPPAHASTFVLMDDRPFPTLEEHWWVQDYPAFHGVLRLQFSRLLNERNQERAMLHVSFNKKDIFFSDIDPEQKWHICTFWEIESNQMFVAMGSKKQLYLWGYNNASGEFTRYLESNDFYTGYSHPSPSIFGWNNGEPLILRIYDGYDPYPGRKRREYELSYDIQTNKIVYRYLGEITASSN